MNLTEFCRALRTACFYHDHAWHPRPHDTHSRDRMMRGIVA
jgi:hypothetical protein